MTRAEGLEAEKDLPDLVQARALLAHPASGLRWHYSLGEALRRAVGEGESRRAVSAVAKQLNISIAKAYQHLWFSGVYSAGEAQRLEKAGTSWSFVVAMMGVEDARRREALLLRAHEGGWTLARLRLELRAVQKPRSAGGRRRRPRQAHGAAVDFARLEAATREWADLYEAAWAGERRREAVAEIARVANDREANDWPDRLRALCISLHAMSERAAELVRELDPDRDDAG